MSEIIFPPFRLDTVNERLWRGLVPVVLKPKTFSVLRYLVEHPDRLITKQELLANLWQEVTVGDAVLKTHLKEIRQALGDEVRSPRFIETAHGRGYRFIAKTEARRPPEGEPPAPSARAPAQGTFVGRRPDLSSLHAWLERAAEGTRQLVFVTGEPGIGKTMLVRTFLEQLSSSPRTLLVAWGQCVDQYGAGEPYLPILEALGRMGRGEGRERLVSLLRRLGPSWLAQMPGLMDPSELTSFERAGSGATPERMLREMAEALETLTRDRPLVLVLEDLHWADYSTLALISYLARRSDPARLFVLGTYRPLEVLAAHHPLGTLQRELQLHERCEELALSYLSQQDVDEYVGARFAKHRFPPALLQLLWARTAGNPLFLVRVVDSWLKRGLLHCDKGLWELDAGLEEVAQGTPASIIAMIEKETERLDVFERGVLDAASVAGMEFSSASVALSLEEDVLRVEELCLHWARRGQFLKLKGKSEWPDGTVGAHCEFIHALYQQVVYERMGVARRQVLHRRIGERQEAAYGAEAHQISAELAVHFARGQDYAKAVRYLLSAGERALGRSAYREGIDHFERGLALLPRLPEGLERLRTERALGAALGVPLAMTQGYASPDLERVYTRVREICRQLDETPVFPAMIALLPYYIVRGSYRVARDLAKQFLALAQEQNDMRLTLESHVLIGVACFFLGEQEVCGANFEQAIALYGPARHGGHILQDPGVTARSHLDHLYWMLGYPERALRLADEAHALSIELSDPFATAYALTSLGILSLMLQKERDALAYAERAVALCSAQGFTFLELTVSMVKGRALVALGELASGEALLVQSWLRRRAIGGELAGTYWLALMAEVYLETARLDDAERVLAEAFELVRGHEERWWEPELHRLRGELLLARGASDDPPLGAAEPCFLAALEAARAMRARSFELRAALGLAQLWSARGERERAQALVAEVYGGFSEGLDTVDLKRARELLERLA